MKNQIDDDQKTHLSISKVLIGKVERIKTGEYAEVRLDVNDAMVVDDRGLIHGGFTFSLADYAAMLSVNHPFVVLKSSNVSFLKPVLLGDTLIAKANVVEKDGNNSIVWCEVFNQNKNKVFEGEFFCISLKEHVLDIVKK